MHIVAQVSHEGLDGGSGILYSVKFSPLFAFFKSYAYSLKMIYYSLKC